MDEKYVMCAPAPAFFLIARSIALSFKSIMIHGETPRGKLRKVGHDLVQVLQCVESLGVIESTRLTAADRSLLPIINGLYSNKEFEYPVTGAKHSPVFGHAHPIAEKLLRDASQIVPHAKQFIAREKAGQQLMASLVYCFADNE